MIELFREIFQVLASNKVRTFLTGIAVAWGIFMLIVLLGMSRGVANSFRSHTTMDNARSLNVYNGYTTKPYRGYSEGRYIELENSDRAEIMSRKSEFIEDVTAARSIDTAKIQTLDEYVSDRILGHYPSELKKARLEILAGRFLNERDLKENRRVMVLQDKNAEILFGNYHDAVGKHVKAMGLSWLVIGVYSHRWETSTYIPYTTSMLLSGNDGKVSDLFVKMKNVKNLEDGSNAEREVREAMARVHEFDPDDESAVHVWNRFNDYLTQSTAMNILDIAVWIIGLFTLLSGVVGVSNIMFVSVRERTHEIGIRRAIGAKPRTILIQVITESVVVTAIFGYAGVVLGMVVTGAIEHFFADAEFLMNPTVDISIALKVTAVLVITGAMAGFIPAIKATKVKPVEALRNE